MITCTDIYQLTEDLWFGPVQTDARKGNGAGEIVGGLFTTQSGEVGGDVDQAPGQEIC